MNLLFKISYGLYVVCAKAKSGSKLDEKNSEKFSGCIVNTFSQQTSTPETFSITVNKNNFTHDLIKSSGECAVAILSTDTTFDTIKRFGMQSGRDVDKFDGIKYHTTSGGIKVPDLPGIMGYFALKVANAIDMGTHTMFVLTSTEIKTFAEKGDALTYDYYQTHIKPKPAETKAEENKEKWVCTVCGYVHEGPLPEDYICPLCNHPASDFEKIQ